MYCFYIHYIVFLVNVWCFKQFWASNLTYWYLPVLKIAFLYFSWCSILRCAWETVKFFFFQDKRTLLLVLRYQKFGTTSNSWNIRKGYWNRSIWHSHGDWRCCPDRSCLWGLILQMDFDLNFITWTRTDEFGWCTVESPVYMW